MNDKAKKIATGASVVTVIAAIWKFIKKLPR